MTSKFVQGLTKQLPRFRNRGIDILRDPGTNKGSAYSLRERQVLGLHGLLPPAILTQNEQVQSVLSNLYQLDDDLGRYNILMSLQDRNEKLFYKTVTSNLNYILPLIYTPTVGKACMNYGMILRRPRGLYITVNDKGHVRSILRNWPEKRVKAVVLTDGERILGLGDLGAHGMGIPIGKLALYTALGGVNPRSCLPLMVDVGTNNQSLLDSEFYNGLKQSRIEKEQYEELMDEILESLVDLYGPNVCVQFEDMANKNGFNFLDRYSKDYVVFNDDILGASAVALAGILSSTRVTNTSLVENKYLFFGAGAAAAGIGNILIAAMQDEGVSEAEAKSRIYMMDSQGLLVKNRPAGINQPHKMKFAREDMGPVDRLQEVVSTIKPSVLIGASAVSKAFTREILSIMANSHKHPVIFALSNPTEKAECTAEAAFKATDCRCLFVSGSPFPSIKTPQDKEFFPSQGNNYYVFPGVAMAVTSAQIRPLQRDMFLTAAKTLAGMVTDDDVKMGRLYPPINKLREVAHKIAVELVTKAFANGTAQYHPEPLDKEAFVQAFNYDPSYVDFTPDEYSWPKKSQ